MKNNSSENNVYTLKRLYLYPTRRCNLRCNHCYISSFDLKGLSGIQEVSLQAIIKVVQQAKPLGLEVVKISGGEPFVRNDMLDICGSIANEDIRLMIESNGTLITKDTAKKLKGYNIWHISVSIDGSNAETHDRRRGKTGAFDNALKGIKHLVSEEINTQILVSLDETNFSQWKKIAYLADDIGASSCKFDIMVDTARARENKLPLLKADTMLNLNKEICELNKNLKCELFTITPTVFKGNKKLREVIKSVIAFCPTLDMLSILDNGKISICGMGSHDENLYLGSVNDSIEKIWREHPKLAEFRKTLAYVVSQHQGNQN
jgi:MoaA/NifB/PqqE/SkfB family radical SAM enzyme